MKMKIYISIFAILVVSGYAHAQDSFKIKGYIYSSDSREQLMKVRLVGNILYVDSTSSGIDTAVNVFEDPNFTLYNSTFKECIVIDSIYSDGSFNEYNYQWKFKEDKKGNLRIKTKAINGDFDKIKLLDEKRISFSYVIFYCDGSDIVYNNKEECEAVEDCEECEGEMF